MRVICIDNVFNGKKLQVEVGETYTASQCSFYPNNYDIAELPTFNGHSVSYRKNLFIPLSDISETEFERNYKSEPCTQQ